MKITKDNVLKFQQENYNFTMERIAHVDWDRLKFELKRFYVFKEKANFKEKIEVKFNNTVMSVPIETIVIGYIEKLVANFICTMDRTSSTYKLRGFTDYIDSFYFTRFEEILKGREILLDYTKFEQMTHEYTYHKGKTQKSFYEKYYTEQCEEFEKFLCLIENIDTEILNLYFTCCNCFFKVKYEDRNGEIL